MYAAKKATKNRTLVTEKMRKPHGFKPTTSRARSNSEQLALHRRSCQHPVPDYFSPDPAFCQCARAGPKPLGPAAHSEEESEEAGAPGAGGLHLLHTWLLMAIWEVRDLPRPLFAALTFK